MATPAALEVLHKNGINGFVLVQRHVMGDWGDLEPEDAQANEDALKYGARLLSVYGVGKERIWIVTEADRSSTCIMLPSDY